MKALAINTATQWTFSGTGHDLTRTHQGWGHPDLATAWNLRNDMFVVDETDVLTELDSTIHTLTVDPGEPAFKATLVYRDRPGTTSSSLHRINDLDLRVTAPGGTVYWGNNGLHANMWSTAGGGANDVDTVENVFVQSPAAGQWLVEVIASEINQDSHSETGALDADYALVVSGANEGPPPAPVADFSASPTSGVTPLAVAFSDLSTGGPNAWSWDFGDGGTSTLQNPGHLYGTPGDYTVILTVTAAGGIDTETRVDYISVASPNVGTNYCSPAVPNSTGNSAVILAQGSANVADNDVTLIAGMMPNDEFGYFIASPTQGFIPTPGGSVGNFCLGTGPMLGRYDDQVQNSGVVGTFLIAIDLTAVPIAVQPGTVAIQPGDTWNFQAWFRDGGTSNFTNGVSVLFL
ncbi:MAG: PKD domain-containing protein [bacterium]|nr:PKD domain-containing protein [bacterium]